MECLGFTFAICIHSLRSLLIQTATKRYPYNYGFEVGKLNNTIAKVNPKHSMYSCNHQLIQKPVLLYFHKWNPENVKPVNRLVLDFLQGWKRCVARCTQEHLGRQRETVREVLAGLCAVVTHCDVCIKHMTLYTTYKASNEISIHSNGQ